MTDHDRAKPIDIVCSFCGKAERGTHSDLANRGWKYVEIHAKDVDQPWWDDGCFDMVAAFTVCSECSEQAKRSFKETAHHIGVQCRIRESSSDEPPPDTERTPT